MRFLLVDGNHAASRSRYATAAPVLRTVAGELTGVLCGTLKTIHWAQNLCRISAENTLIFWDDGLARGRVALYPEYKANRINVDPTAEEKAALEDFRRQCAAARTGLALLGSRQIRHRGCEADDLISITATAYADAGHDCVIFSGDADFQQLASDRISILLPQEKRVWTAEDVCKKWGISKPEKLPELRSLLGVADSSDNIKGIPGIGEKKAAVLFPVRYLIFTDEPTTDPHLQKLLDQARPHREILNRNYRLMRLPRNWAESFYNDEEARGVLSQFSFPVTRDISEFIRFCERWEFTSILEGIASW